MVHGGRGCSPRPTAGRDGARWRRQGAEAGAALQVCRTADILFLGRHDHLVFQTRVWSRVPRPIYGAACTAQACKTEKIGPFFISIVQNLPPIFLWVFDN